MVINKLLPALAAYSISHGALYAQSIEERVEELEFSQMSDIVKFGGQFDYRYDSYSLKNPEFFTLDSEGNASFVDIDDTYNVERMYIALDANVEYSPDTELFMRFSMSKYVNGAYFGFNNYANTFDETYDSGKSERGPALYVERAYLNHRIMKGLTLTLGRLPTLDGPPNHLFDGVSRKGSYPSWFFGYHLDGSAITYSHAFNDTNKLSLRYINSPFQTPSVDEFGRVSPGHSHKSVSTMMADYTASGFSFSDYINFISITAALELEFLGASTTYTMFTNHLEVANVAKTGLSLGVTVTSTKFDSKGAISGFSPIFDGAGFGTNGTDETVKGAGTMITASYKPPVSWISAIGAQIFSTDENFWLYSTSTDWPFWLETNRGSASHYWVTFALKDNIKIRTGLGQAKSSHAASDIGAAVESKQEESSMYAQLHWDY